MTASCHWAVAVVLVALGCSNRAKCTAAYKQALALVSDNKADAAREWRVEVWKECGETEGWALDKAIAQTEKRNAPPPVPREPTPAEVLASKRQISSALAIVQPMFGDSVNALDAGAATFAAWSAQHMLWSDLQAQTETKHALVLKDPALARGKRLCASGMVAEIKVDRSVAPPVYVGGLVGDSLKVTRFIAVHSTGELVENSYARICGIVTGTQSYTNSGGGSTEAAFIVGMFDLPENKKP